MTTDRTEAEPAEPPRRRSRRRWLIIAGITVVVLAIAPFALITLGHLTEGDVPSFPSLIDRPEKCCASRRSIRRRCR